MKQPKKPTLINKKLMERNGYDPESYMVYYEDNLYLHIIPKGGKPVDVIMIEKD